MKYAFIEAHRKKHRIQTMCRILGVARSGFYAWLHRPLSDRGREDRRLLELIRASGFASGGVRQPPRLGRPSRVGHPLRQEARCPHHERAQDPGCPGYKRPRHRPGRPAALAPNRLQQQFTMHRPDEAWVTDITYLRTWQGWLYLAVVIDLYSRRVVGWSMKSSLHREIVLDALLMAVWQREPRQHVVVHSDQGTQYGSDEWQRFCRAHRLQTSMSRRGNCYDNAVAESFFSSLKKERIRQMLQNPGRSPG